jgi:hypothetical protein
MLFRCLFVASGVFALVGFASLMILTNQFIDAPLAADPGSGRIIPWSNHGTYHYITPRESALQNALLLFFVVMFFCLALFGYLDQRTRRRV